MQGRIEWDIKKTEELGFDRCKTKASAISLSYIVLNKKVYAFPRMLG